MVYDPVCFFCSIVASFMLLSPFEPFPDRLGKHRPSLAPASSLSFGMSIVVDRNRRRSMDKQLQVGPKVKLGKVARGKALLLRLQLAPSLSSSKRAKHSSRLILWVYSLRGHGYQRDLDSEDSIADHILLVLSHSIHCWLD